MTANLKPLVVVLALAGLIFLLARPLCLRYMSAEAFARRRNVWLVLTAAAFISPSFWLYLVVAVPLIAWLGSKDDNPAAVALLLLHVIPPINVELPAAVINRLFELNNFRLLALLVLLPAALRLMYAREPGGARRFLVPDVFVLGYALLQLVLLMPYESFTNTMRRGFLMGLDMLLVYYVFSRVCIRRGKLVDALASFVLAGALMAVVAVFEQRKGWLLYTGLNQVWGDPNVFAWLMRGGDLRAQAAAGHSLTLGYLLAMGFALWLGLRLRELSRARALAVAACLWLGLIATVSRGPWVVAAGAYLAYYMVAPVKLSAVVARLVGIALAAAAVLASPLGPGIIARLPFIGSVDAGTVDYRQQLAIMSWQLIKQNPLFGNPFVLTQMESLRQGQGIIDLVNSYASIAMFYGVVGLVLFLGSFLYGLLRSYGLARRMGDVDTETAHLGAALVAAMFGTLLMLAVGSFGKGLAVFYWALAGMSAGYVAMVVQLPRRPLAPVPQRPRYRTAPKAV